MKTAKTRKAENISQTLEQKQTTEPHPIALAENVSLLEIDNRLDVLFKLQAKTSASDPEYDAILKYVSSPKRMAFFVAPDTENNKIIACSKSLLDYFNLKGNTIIGQPIWTVINRLINRFVPLEDRQPVITQQQMLGEMAKGGIHPLPYVRLNAIKNEQPIELHIIGKHFFSKEGTFLGTLLEYHINQISEYKPLVSPTPQEILTIAAERNRWHEDSLAKFEEAAKIALPISQQPVPPVPSTKPNIEYLKKRVKQLTNQELKEFALFVQLEASERLSYVPRVAEPKKSYHQKFIDGKFYWYAAWSENGKSKIKYVGTELPTTLDPSQVSIKYHPDYPDKSLLASPLQSSRRRSR